MPPTTATKTITLTPRAVEAVWRTLELFEASDPKRLASVLVEIASEEAEHNARFAAKVRVLYEALSAVQSAGARTTTRTRAPKIKMLPADIVPIKHVEGRPFDLGAPPDPSFLLEVFGTHQLADVLNLYSGKALEQAVEIVQERQPGGKPSGKTKPKLIAYIVRALTNTP